MNPDQQPNRDETPQTDEPQVENPVGVPGTQQESAPAPTPSAPSLDGISPAGPTAPVEEPQPASATEPVSASPVSPGAPVESSEPAVTPVQPEDTSVQPVAAPAKKSHTMMILVIALVVVVLVAAVVAAYFFMQ